MKKSLIIIPLIIAGFFLTACNPLQRKQNSGLQVITQDKQVSLFLNGQYLDKSPFIDKEIKAGTYNLRIEPDDTNFVAQELVINLRPGLLTVVTWKPGESAETSGGVTYELEPIKSKKAEVSFITIPDNALIQFDSQEKQFSPLILSDLEPGHHEFEVSLPSYENQKHTINIIAGHRLNVSVKLANIAEPATSKTDESVENNNQQTELDIADQNKSDQLQSQLQASSSGQLKATNKVIIKSTNFYFNGQEVLKIRETASNVGKVIGYAKVGQEYILLDSQSDWYQIQFDQQQAGWISSNFASKVGE